MTEYRGDGLRAEKIREAREREMEDTEIQKRKIANNMEMKNVADKFTATYDSVAVEISAATVSLVEFIYQFFGGVYITIGHVDKTESVWDEHLFARWGWSP
jgi:hypothetical protein